jgi:hypothetical protein
MLTAMLLGFVLADGGTNHCFVRFLVGGVNMPAQHPMDFGGVMFGCVALMRVSHGLLRQLPVLCSAFRELDRRFRFFDFAKQNFLT